MAVWADDEVHRVRAEFVAVGIRIERVLTDNGASYRSRAFAAVLERLGARHRWTRPYRPQTNGKAERFIRTLLDEWAYVRLYRSNAERLAAYPATSTSTIDVVLTPRSEALSRWRLLTTS